jgi:hemerythrin-like domain-containing protein
MANSVEDRPPAIHSAFESLLSEHLSLVAVAQAFEAYGRELQEDTGPAASDLMKFCVYFREYGGTIHHEKEERIALAALSLHGFQAGGAPRAQMHDEHEREHAMLLEIIRYALPQTGWKAEERTHLGELCSKYAAHLRAHLAAEELSVYPQMSVTLTEPELASVRRKLERFDEAHNHASQLDWLRALAGELVQSYAK